MYQNIEQKGTSQMITTDIYTASSTRLLETTESERRAKRNRSKAINALETFDTTKDVPLVTVW